MQSNYLTESYYYSDFEWQIMSIEEGINKKIMNKMFDQLATVINQHSKVFLVRFDVRLYVSSKTNILISKFRNLLNRKIQKKYNCKTGYIWVREQTLTAEHPHYHYAVFLNGHNIRKSFGLKPLIEHVCYLLVNISVYFPDNNSYMIKRDDLASIQQAIYRLSYLAKNQTKGFRAPQTSDYQTSRLKVHLEKL